MDFTYENVNDALGKEVKKIMAVRGVAVNNNNNNVTIQSIIRKTAFSRLPLAPSVTWCCSLLASRQRNFQKYIHFSKLNACIL